MGISQVLDHPLEQLRLLPAAQLTEEMLDLLQALALHDNP
jgi:hypothetical protein